MSVRRVSHVVLTAWLAGLASTGALAEPIPVATAAELDAIRDNLAGEYVLTADIDLAGYGGEPGWLPVGTEAAPFTGVLDGDGHAISSLTIYRTDLDRLGLFGYLGEGSRVEHLRLLGADISCGPSSNAGVLAGGIWRGSVSNVAVADGVTTGGIPFVSRVTGSDRCGVGGITGGAYGTPFTNVSSSANLSAGFRSGVGGLAGVTYSSQFHSCSAMGTASAGDGEPFQGSPVGGLVGYASTTSLTDCTANVRAIGGSHARVGGLVGESSGMTVTNCTAHGNASGGDESLAGGLLGFGDRSKISLSSAAGAVSVGYDAIGGGLVGVALLSEIKTSRATGPVVGGDLGFLGGLAGVCDRTPVEDSGAAGSVDGGIRASVGGLVGFGTYSRVDRSVATGDVSGQHEARVGGLIGHQSRSNVYMTYASGDVTAGDDSMAGGLLGECGGGAAIGDSYALGAVTAGARSLVGGLSGGAWCLGPGAQSWAAGPVSNADGATSGGLVAVVGDILPYSSFWNTETTGQATSAGEPGAMPRTTDQMTFPFSPDTYNGWNFATIWNPGDESHHNNGYPFHYWQTARHTVVYASDSGGSLSGPTTQVRIPGASTAPVAATPGPNHRFAGWSDGRTDNPRVDRNVTADFSVTAVFLPTATLWILE